MLEVAAQRNVKHYCRRQESRDNVINKLVKRKECSVMQRILADGIAKHAMGN